MAVSVKEVEQLNTEIEDLNTERTKTEAKVEMLKKRLNDELAGFEKKYGVSLKGKTLKETAENIIRERNRVAEEIESEYNLKKQVVDAINNGNISLANSLLGVETAEVENVVDEAEKTVAKEEAGKPKKTTATITSAKKASATTATASQTAPSKGRNIESLTEQANNQKAEPEEDIDGFDDFGFDEPESEPVKPVKKEEPKAEPEVEDDEDDFGFDPVDSSDDKEAANLSAASLGFGVDDSDDTDDSDDKSENEDTDDEDDDYGFGDISF